MTDAGRSDGAVEPDVAPSRSATGPAPLFDRLAGLLHHQIQAPLEIVVAHARRLVAEKHPALDVADTANAIIEAANRMAAALAEFDAVRRAFRRRPGAHAPVDASTPPASAVRAGSSGETDGPGEYLARTGLDIHRSGHRVTCRVHLRCAGSAIYGEASEIDSATGRGRAAARATLAAAEQALDGSILSLDGLAVIDLFGRRYVAIAVEIVHRRSHAHVAGIAPLDNSIEDAACFASLDALGRPTA